LPDPALADPKTIFVTFAGKVFPGIGGEVLNWIIAFMLIIALALSALNAIMGSGRAIYQMAIDGEFPTWFTKVNEHGVPARAMAFNVVASLIVVLMGGAVEIYSFSNVDYTCRSAGADRLFPVASRTSRSPAPFKLPEFMKYAAAIGVGLLQSLALRRQLVLEAGQRQNLLLASGGRRCSPICRSIGTALLSRTSAAPPSKPEAKPA
jgi:amino acid transporter